MSERLYNRDCVKAYDICGDRSVKLLEVDTHKVKYQGRHWYELDGNQKRKLENLLVFDNPQQRVKFRYI